MIALHELSAGLTATDRAAAERATGRAPAGPGTGRLNELHGWLAATQRRSSPSLPTPVRCVRSGPVPETVAALAAEFDVGLRSLEPFTTVEEGAALADAEVEAGTELVVLAGAASPVLSAALTAALSGAEPVAVLPRGAQATDTAAWIERAGRVRDLRRALMPVRDQPDELLEVLASSALNALSGFLLRAVARRTPVVVDGQLALAAALLGSRLSTHLSGWLQVANSTGDPVEQRIVRELGRRPLLELGPCEVATAGLLAIPLLHAAALPAAQPQ